MFNEVPNVEFLIGCGTSDYDRKNSFVSKEGVLYAPQQTKYVTGKDSDETVEDSLLITRRVLIDIAHPVGSYYWSSVETNPGKLFPGTNWTQIKDRFVLAAGDEYSVGATGGKATHTLTEEEMPSHKHYFWQNPSAGAGSGSWEGLAYAIRSKLDSNGEKGYTSSTGSTQPHNNMPPYIVAYCWRRDS